MSSGSVKRYVIDTNLFVSAFRDEEVNVQLQRFHVAHAPFEYLSAVVVQELLAGARTRRARLFLDRHVLQVYSRRGRIVTPTDAAWRRSGEVLADLARLHALEPGRITKSFGNDILLALSCREAGLVLVTDNRRDFERIARVAPFSFVAPWPGPSGD